MRRFFVYTSLLLCGMAVLNSAKAADVNGDGVLDMADLAYLKSVFHTDDVTADLDRSGRVDVADMAILKAAMGYSQTHERGTVGDVFVSMSPSAVSTTPSTQFSLDVVIDFTADPTIGGAVDISYDPTALTFVSWTYDTSTLNDDPDIRTDPVITPGAIKDIAVAAFFGLQQTGIMGTITFEAAQQSVSQVTPGESQITPWAADDGTGRTQFPIYSAADISVGATPTPDITVTPPDVFFEDTEVGSTSTVDLLVSNDGTADLVLGDIALADPLAAPFSISADGCSLQVLTPSSSCVVSVSFSPTAVGLNSDSLDVPSNDPLEPVISVGVQGSGTVLLSGPEVVLGGADMFAGFCVNSTTGQRVFAPASADNILDCINSGLAINSGDSLLLIHFGTATSDSITGGVSNFNQTSVSCRNSSTQQSLGFLAPFPVWNCTNRGLIASPGDTITMVVNGFAP